MEDFMDKATVKKMTAEAVGTFLLVFLAVGTAVLTANLLGVNVVATALAFGLVIVILANTTIGAVSGCHINPAVSLGVFVAQKLSGKKEFGSKELISYVIAQFIGAVAGATLLYGILRLSGFNFLIWGTNEIYKSAIATSEAQRIFYLIGSGASAFIIEIVLTAIFVFMILFAVNNEKAKKHAGLIIGTTLTLVHLVGIGFAGTSVNPARSFGPALMRMVFAGGWEVFVQETWIFLLAPLVGAAAAAIAYHLIYQRGKPEEANAPGNEAQNPNTEAASGETAEATSEVTPGAQW
ncbi:MAG: aquaporin [Firmicutes bacterium]|nr:aquaporin [Bacillota bacterium]